MSLLIQKTKFFLYYQRKLSKPPTSCIYCLCSHHTTVMFHFQSLLFFYIVYQFTEVFTTQMHALCFNEINNKGELQVIVVLNSSHKADIMHMNVAFIGDPVKMCHIIL